MGTWNREPRKIYPEHLEFQATYHVLRIRMVLLRTAKSRKYSMSRQRGRKATTRGESHANPLSEANQTNRPVHSTTTTMLSKPFTRPHREQECARPTRPEAHGSLV